MHCSNCGVKASGNFCCSCGARLALPTAQSTPLHDWKHEFRCDALLQLPEVRDLVARHASQAKTRISAEQFLGICDKAFSPLVGVSLDTVASIAVPIFSRLGVGTGKNRSELLSAPIGKTLIAVLCSLARHGYALKQIHPGEDGCVLEAKLPSDAWSWEGDLVISVHRRAEQTQVETATRIRGQMFDWGKSTRCLSQLFEDLGSLTRNLDHLIGNPGSVQRCA